MHSSVGKPDMCLVFHRLISAALVLTTWTICGAGPVVLQNYGVIFEPIGDIATTPDIFNMTINIGMGRSSQLSTCKGYDGMDEQAELLENLKSQDVTILNMIKYLCDNNPRWRRAAVQVIGYILKALFGVSTVPDNQRLAKKLGLLDSRIHENKLYNVDRDMLIARLAVSHNGLLEHSKLHAQEVEKILQKWEVDLEIIRLGANNNSEEIVRSEKMRICNLEITNALANVEQSSKLIGALIKAKGGSLDVGLISPSDLKAGLNLLELKLEELNQPFKISRKNLEYYYRRATTHVQSRMGDTIFISVEVPIIRNKVDHTCYRVRNLKTPAMLSDKPSAYTKITNLPKYLCVNSTSYTEEVGFKTKQDSRPIAFSPLGLRSCSLALLDNSPEEVSKLCTKILVPRGRPHITHYPVSNSEHMIYTMDKIGRMRCGHNIQKLNWEEINMISIPCGCLVTSESFSISTEGILCPIKFNISRLVHGVNLASLEAFKIPIAGLHGSTEISKEELGPLRANLTLLTASDYFNKENKNSWDLSEATRELVKQDKKEQFDLHEWVSDISTYTPAPISLLFSITSLAISLYCYCRIQRLLAYLVMVKGAAALQLTHHTAPPIEFTREEGETPVVDMGDWTSPTTQTYLGYVGVLALLLFVCYKLLKLCRRAGPAIPLKTKLMSGTGTHVYLRLVAGVKAYDFEVTPLTHQVEAMKLVSSPAITRLRVLKCFPSKLVCHWTGPLKYTVNGKEFVVRFPRQLRVSWFGGQEIKKVIQGELSGLATYIADGHGNSKQLRAEAMQDDGTSSESDSGV